jgi:hypothetical protein
LARCLHAREVLLSLPRSRGLFCMILNAGRVYWARLSCRIHNEQRVVALTLVTLRTDQDLL